MLNPALPALPSQAVRSERATLRPSPASLADVARRSEVLRIANLCWAGLGGVALAAMPFYPGELVLLVILVSVTSVSFVIIDALQRNGRTRLGGILFCGVIDATVYGLLLLNYRIHGFEDLEANLTRVSAFAFMGAAILFAGATIGRRAPLGFALLNTILLIVAAVFVDSRLGPKVSIPSFWWFLAVAVWLYERHVSRAFAGLEEAHGSLERKVDERTRDLREALVRLDQARRELESSNAELESFSYSVAHDLKGPLRRIVGFSEILEADYGGRLDEGGRQSLEVIRGQSRRMDQLIEALMKLARAGRTPLAKVDVDVSAMAAEIAEDLKAKDSGRSVAWAIEPGLRCRADPGLMRVVLGNLLVNAWKFTSKTAEARIEIGSRSRRQIFVRDNGVGFDPSYAAQLFQPFVRLHTESEFSGSGIGLATVARIVKRHGGSIRAEGGPGKGATFTFSMESEESP